jgi:hypothetical protein
MGRLFVLLGLLLTLGAPAHALSLRTRAILAPNPCTGITLKTDFTANGGGGVFCLNGQRYASFTAMPGASYSGSVSGGGATVRTAVNSAGAVVRFADGAPRITDLGLLVEEARTNIIFPSLVPNSPPGSTDRWNAAWSGGVNVFTANGLRAPDGTITATKVVTGVNGLDGPYFRSSVLPAANAVWTASAWIYSPSGGNIWLAISETGGTAWTGVAQVKLVVPAGQWTRISFSRTAAASITANTIGVAFLADLAGQAFYVWGAQFEAGATASSYIPATIAAGSRAADAATFTYSPIGSAATLLYGASGSVSPSPSSPINLGASSSGVWINNNVRSLTVAP